eukprot:scaffold6730_cov20-Tisochrysis_lutea.AAC.3
MALPRALLSDACTVPGCFTRSSVSSTLGQCWRALLPICEVSHVWEDLPRVLLLLGPRCPPAFVCNRRHPTACLATELCALSKTFKARDNASISYMVRASFDKHAATKAFQQASSCMQLSRLCQQVVTTKTVENNW